MIIYWIYVIVLLLLIAALFIPKSQQEGFCGTTGMTYSDIQKVPDTTSLNRDPPFYDLNAVRPPACAYRNYMFPPPMDYSDTEDCLEGNLAKRYMYWYTNPMLSTSQTPYTV